MIRVLAFLVFQYTLCLTIRVPIEWNDNSEVQKDQLNNQNDLPVETSAPKPAQQIVQKTIPTEYFEYTANKPQFAVEVANFHGVKSPENHFKAHPVIPHTGVNKPELGKHKIFDPRKQVHAPYRQFINNNKHLTHVTPVSTKYNIFHPYKVEEPALKIIYRDPFLSKVQNDVRATKNRLQLYENSAGESDIKTSENLESPNETDRKKSPPQNKPTQFEIHRPQRRPAYYMPPITKNNRDNILNNKIRHPWGQSYGKVTPNHYRPIKNHLQNIRQQHALKYGDENNEYPQLQPAEIHEEKPDGYDIYEKGKEKFSQLRNDVDESITKAVNENRPSRHQALELQSTSNENENDDDEVEFSPVKNYAQVRKIETVKHVPRDAAFFDADTYEDILNAPRLREAVKSSKAHTIYSEEGYEDAAYDHAGEQKHASDHEGHGGYLKENEASEGKYKIPSFNGKYEDAKGSSYGDSIIHGEKWKNNEKEKEELKEENDYSENDSDYFIENNEDSQRLTNDHTNKRNAPESEHFQDQNSQHDLTKRETNFEVPEIKLSSTFLTEEELQKKSQNKTQLDKFDHTSSKYPYYYQTLEAINKDSPLRYAENLKNIPKKTKGGTEFYDSRNQYECPEVDDNVDPIPEKIKKGGHPDDNNEDDDDQSSKESDKKQRLKGLGDKIDCFKVKYFGENPLDSPFFEEDLISHPEPITAPISNIFKLYDEQNNPLVDETQTNNGMNQERVKHNIIKDNDKVKEGIYVNKHLARKKRATPFIYEPYKIIRDSQNQDSKKTTTSSNVSPLIKQLQSSRVVDRVTTNLNKDQPVKRNTGNLTYKNISKKDREKNYNTSEKEITNITFVDVNEGLRQGEPRFEQRPLNHKFQYTPIQLKKSMSPEDYKNHTSDTDTEEKSKSQETRTEREHNKKNDNSNREFFDVSKYLPESLELQKPESSNKVKKIREFSDHKPDALEADVVPESQESKESDEYDEYDDDEDEEIVLTTTSTTTTSKPTMRKRIRILTTTSTPRNEEIVDQPVPKLQLTTRFRNPIDKGSHAGEVSRPINKKMTDEDDINIPKYREKKRKSAKSTFVTDTKSYDEGNDDTRKEDIDKLIGIKHDMEEYIPHYEKENETKQKLNSKTNYKNDSETDDRNDDEDEDDSEEGDEDDEDDEDDDDSDSNDDSADTKDSDESIEDDIEVTTPEPTKQTLLETTIAPETTTAVRKIKIDLKPEISKKKIEIHKDLPGNNNLTQFKQDIKEIEVIKEIPGKTSQKNEEILQLYKDENLAREVNKIFDVEIFDDDVDLKDGPRHGGNYRSIESMESENTPTLARKENIEEPLNFSRKVSPSVENETTKHTKRKQERRRQHENVRTRSTTQRSRRSRGPNPRIRDLNNAPNTLSGTTVQGGNLKLDQGENRSNQNKKSEKLIELNEEHDEDNNGDGSGNMHGGNFKSYGNSRSSGRDLHGGNYRSARITQANEHNKQPSRRRKENKDDNSKHMTTNSISVLDTFARVIPTLTTSAPFILDPSKRMYYYVDS
ncbi:nucleolar protein dao-5 [Papilio machaon]|uniref:nucleolar protein dao-5 n=1 Tax=Papilio machaon TaxID=76193 RepID=UPI001E662FBE|nr:nucleolar protein dao-5 [Papilio machaon]